MLQVFFKGALHWQNSALPWSLFILLIIIYLLIFINPFCVRNTCNMSNSTSSSTRAPEVFDPGSESVPLIRCTSVSLCYGIWTPAMIAEIHVSKRTGLIYGNLLHAQGKPWLNELCGGARFLPAFPWTAVSPFCFCTGSSYPSCFGAAVWILPTPGVVLGLFSLFQLTALEKTPCFVNRVGRDGYPLAQHPALSLS